MNKNIYSFTFIYYFAVGFRFVSKTYPKVSFCKLHQEETRKNINYALVNSHSDAFLICEFKYG